MEFSDLQRSWSDRFPTDKLSLIFEEDIKTLLATHKARVGQLRKELAQEEFLVEYFEKALNDERQRRRSVTSEETRSPLGPLSRENSLKGDPRADCADPENFVTVIAVSSSEEEVRPLKKKPPAPPPKRVAAKWPPASVVSSLGLASSASAPSTPTDPDSPSDGAGAAMSTFGKANERKFHSQLSNQSTSSNTSAFHLALNNFSSREASTEPSTPVGGTKPLRPMANAGTSASDLSSQSKSNDSSLERNTNTVQSTDSSLERKSILSIGHHAERSGSSCKLDRHTSNASSLGRPSDTEGSNGGGGGGGGGGGCGANSHGSGGTGNNGEIKKSSTLHLLKDHNSKDISGDFSDTQLDFEPGSHRKLDKTSTLSSNDSSFDGLDDAPIYDTVAADEDEDYDGVRCASEQDYVEFGGYGRIPASLVTDSTEDDSDAEDQPRRRKLLNKTKSCDDLTSSSSTHPAGPLETKPTRKPPPVPGKSEAAVAPQIPLRRGKSEERLDGDSGVYSSSMESYLSSKTSPQFRPKKSKEKHENEIPEKQLRQSTGSNGSLAEDEREIDGVVKKIVESVIESETAYVDCLDVLYQYGKALSSATRTNQAVLSREDVDTIFFKIEQLLDVHRNFRDGLRRNLQVSNNQANPQTCEIRRPTIGENFKFLASRLEVYNLFLQNYSKAIDAVRRCSQNNAKFEELSKNMKMKGQTTSLENLLHKPVARIQKNALVIDDLLRATSAQHQDYNNLKVASKLTQRFLENLKMNSTLESMFPPVPSVPQDRVLRHVVRNVFMVQLDGNRKLRHLFLFNDVLVCAKCKTNGRTRYLEVKWFIPLSEVTLLDPEAEAEPIREQHPANVCQLRSRANSIRDQIRKLENKRGPVGCQGGVTTSRSMDKLRRKLSDLEADLMLHSPNLPFKIGHKNNKVYQFFVSSEFERQQWIEAIYALQAQQPAQTAGTMLSSQAPPTVYELNSCIASAGHKNNLGNTARPSEDRLLGELHLQVNSLQGGEGLRQAAVHISFEIDSYGHFFRKGRTKTVDLSGGEAKFNQEIIMDVDGSQTLRILFYEEMQQGPLLRGKATFELSKSWLTDQFQNKSISLQEHTLNLSIKYVPYQVCLRRNLDSKPVGTFGMKIEQVCKKEKSTVPFLIGCCVREVEKRGINEVGIYRISGSNSDVQRLRKAFESNPYEAEQLLKEVDVNAVAHLLKLYLRELPEALFTDELYPNFFEALSKPDPDEKSSELLALFQRLPAINRNIVMHLVEHMVVINRHEEHNKMSINNLATVFGPTLIRPGAGNASHDKDLLTTGTVDVMAQAGILHFFLKRRVSGLPLEEPIESAHM